MRADKLLWFLRFAPSRNVAQAMAESGHIRRNGARIARAAAPVSVGDVLVVPLAIGVRVIELLAIPGRRGPAEEARTCYRVLDGPGAHLVAAAITDALKGDLQP